MDKKITIKDIAREAGVSTATVSYVINNREDQNISEETKNKVLQVVNLFNYKPNLLAKSLRSLSEDKYIAIYVDDDLDVLFKSEFLNFCQNIAKSFAKYKFELVLLTKPYSQLNNVDAILSLNNTYEEFKQIGKLNLIPLIGIDTNVDDNIFFTVTGDFDNLKKIADDHFNCEYAYVCLNPKDETIKNEILSIFKKVVFINNANDINKINDDNIFLTQGELAQFIKLRFPNKNICYYSQYIKDKCDVITECVKHALSHEQFEKHKFKV